MFYHFAKIKRKIQTAKRFEDYFAKRNEKAASRVYIAKHVLHPRHPRLISLIICMFRTCGTYTQAYTQATPKFSRKFIRQWPLYGNYSMTNSAQWPLHENYSMTNSAQWPLHEKYSMTCYFLLQSAGCRLGCRLGCRYRRLASVRIPAR